MRQRDHWKRCGWTVALVVWGLLAYPVPGECALYGTDQDMFAGGSRLLRINRADAPSTVVGTVPNWYATDTGAWNRPISSLAYNPADGFLYGTDNTPGSRLLRINRADASSRVVGTVPDWYAPIGMNLAISSLAYSPADGCLYGTDGAMVEVGSRLLRINPANACSTVVGTVPNWYATDTGAWNMPISSLAYNPADGFLYSTDYTPAGSRLLRINPGDASSTVVGTVPNWYADVGANPSITGLAYNTGDGFLYGTDSGIGEGSRLLRINPADGSSTVMGIVPNWYAPLGVNLPIRSLAYVPPTHFLGTGVSWVGVDGIADAVNLQETFDDRLRFPDTTDTTSLQLHSVDAGNLGLFKTQLGLLAERVRPGDTVILSFSSHGDSDKTGTEIPCWTRYKDATGNIQYESRTGQEYVLLSEDAGDRLYDRDLLALLKDSRFSAVKKIVILDCCRSGGFGPDLAWGLTNVAVLAACDEGEFSFAAFDGTGFFTNVLICGLTEVGNYFRADTNHDGVLTLDELKAYVNAYAFGDLIGQELPLKEPGGTAPFTGINMVSFTSPDFDGVIGASMPEPGTLMLLALGGLALLRRRAT
ncbi:MAG: caspase family protein [Candidatus Hydrogenedentes bacterium]|nr:caspase family protein [Candidatus Hydrogenedentota bacterium]